MWDSWVAPVLDWAFGAAPAVADTGTQALGAGAGAAADATGAGGFSIMPFLGDLWNTASQFASSDLGKSAIGMGAMAGLSALDKPQQMAQFPGNASFGPIPNLGAKAGASSATPAPPGTNVSPIFQDKQPGVQPSQGLDVEEQIRKSKSPVSGGMGITSV
jgi:hypothetical protein